MTVLQVGQTWFRNADKAPAEILTLVRYAQDATVTYRVFGVKYTVSADKFVKFYSQRIIEDSEFARKLAADLGVLLDRTTELATTVRKIADLVGIES